MGEIGGEDERHSEFLRGADLVLHDAQYTAKEYPAKIGWGHSPVEYAVRIARHAGVATLALTHHDPLRDDESLDLLVEDIRAGLKKKGSSLEVFAAAEGQSIQVNPGTVHLPENPEGDHQAKAAIDPARKRRSVVLAVSGR